MLPETRYVYPVARIRVVELNMLDSNRIERMLSSDTFSDAIRVLYEMGYPEHDDYEEVLKESTGQIYDYLKEITPEPELFNMFTYRYDAHNIKILLKSEMMEDKGGATLEDNGVFEKNALRIMIREREFEELPEEFVDAIEKSIDIFARTKNPQAVDVLMDGAYYSVFRRMAEETKNSFLIKLARMMIDISNINAFIRIKLRMENLDLLSRVLLKGGEIPIETYIQSYGNDLETFAERLDNKDYKKLIGYITKERGLTEFEKACDNYLLNFVKKSRHKPYGIEPVIGYLMGRETDIKNARIILVGKINKMRTDVIRERLRESYV